MTVGNHVDLRARDLAVVREKMGDSYEFVCCDSQFNAMGEYTMWKAKLEGEMKGYTFYIHVREGRITSSSLS